jgi:hypothetical protein
MLPLLPVLALKILGAAVCCDFLRLACVMEDRVMAESSSALFFFSTLWNLPVGPVSSAITYPCFAPCIPSIIK